MAVSKVWAFLAAIFIIIAPFVNEVWEIYKVFKSNNQVRPHRETEERMHANTSAQNDNDGVHATKIGDGSEANKTEDNVTVDNVHLSAVA